MRVFLFLLLVSIFFFNFFYPCVVPEDDLEITSDTILCSGTYHINDGGNLGVVRISGDGITLTCNDTVLVSDDHGGAGFVIDGNNIILVGCEAHYYKLGGFRLRGNNLILKDIIASGDSSTQFLIFGYDVNNLNISNFRLWASFSSNALELIDYSGVSISDGRISQISYVFWGEKDSGPCDPPLFENVSIDKPGENISKTLYGCASPTYHNSKFLEVGETKSPGNYKEYEGPQILFEASFPDNLLSSGTCRVVVNETEKGEFPTSARSVYINISQEGLYYWDFNCTDSDGNFLSSNLDMPFYVVNTSPFDMNISYPKNNSWHDDLTISVFLNSNKGILEKYYSLNGGPFQNLGNSITVPSDGEYNLTIKAKSTSGEWDNDTVVFYVDTSPPVINISLPQNNSIFENASNISLLVFAEDHIEGCSLDWENSEYPAVFGDLSFPNGETHSFSVSTNGTFDLWIYCTDYAGRDAEEERVIHVLNDDIPPKVSIEEPSVNISNKSQIWISAEMNEHVIQAWYSIDNLTNGTLNIDNQPEGDAEVFGYANFTDGNHTLFVFAVDEGGNMGYDSFDLLVDTLPPEITISSPDGEVKNNNKSFLLNVSVNEKCFNLSYSLDGSDFIQFDNPENITLSDFGNHSVSVRCWDKGNNIGYSSKNFTLSPESVYVTISSPHLDQDIGNETTLSVLATSGENLTYFVDGKKGNKSFKENAYGYHYLSLDFAPNESGYHCVNVTCEVGGLVNSSKVCFYAWPKPPELYVYHPNNSIVYTSKNLAINITSVDYRRNQTIYDDIATPSYYKIDGGLSHILGGPNVPFSVGDDGWHTLFLHVENSLKMYNETSIEFYVDSTPPNFLSTSPKNGTVFYDRDLNISFSVDEKTGNRWIICNGNNYPVSCIFDGGVDFCQGNLTNLSDGPYNCTIFVEDIYGNKNNASLSFSVRYLPPECRPPKMDVFGLPEWNISGNCTFDGFSFSFRHINIEETANVSFTDCTFAYGWNFDEEMGITSLGHVEIINSTIFANPIPEGSQVVFDFENNSFSFKGNAIKTTSSEDIGKQKFLLKVKNGKGNIEDLTFNGSVGKIFVENLSGEIKNISISHYKDTRTSGSSPDILITNQPGKINFTGFFVSHWGNKSRPAILLVNSSATLRDFKEPNLLEIINSSNVSMDNLTIPGIRIINSNLNIGIEHSSFNQEFSFAPSVYLENSTLDIHQSTVWNENGICMNITDDSNLFLSFVDFSCDLGYISESYLKAIRSNLPKIHVVDAQFDGWNNCSIKEIVIKSTADSNYSSWVNTHDCTIENISDDGLERDVNVSIYTSFVLLDVWDDMHDMGIGGIDINLTQNISAGIVFEYLTSGFGGNNLRTDSDGRAPIGYLICRRGHESGSHLLMEKPDTYLSMNKSGVSFAEEFPLKIDPCATHYLFFNASAGPYEVGNNVYRELEYKGWWKNNITVHANAHLVIKNSDVRLGAEDDLKYGIYLYPNAKLTIINSTIRPGGDKAYFFRAEHLTFINITDSRIISAGKHGTEEDGMSLGEESEIWLVNSDLRDMGFGLRVRDADVYIINTNTTNTSISLQLNYSHPYSPLIINKSNFDSPVFVVGEPAGNILVPPIRIENSHFLSNLSILYLYLVNENTTPLLLSNNIEGSFYLRHSKVGSKNNLYSHVSLDLLSLLNSRYDVYAGTEDQDTLVLNCSSAFLDNVTFLGARDATHSGIHYFAFCPVNQTDIPRISINNSVVMASNSHAFSLMVFENREQSKQGVYDVSVENSNILGPESPAFLQHFILFINGSEREESKVVIKNSVLDSKNTHDDNLLEAHNITSILILNSSLRGNSQITHASLEINDSSLKSNEGSAILSLENLSAFIFNSSFSSNSVSHGALKLNKTQISLNKVTITAILRFFPVGILADNSTIHFTDSSLSGFLEGIHLINSHLYGHGVSEISGNHGYDIFKGNSSSVSGYFYFGHNVVYNESSGNNEINYRDTNFPYSFVNRSSLYMSKKNGLPFVVYIDGVSTYFNGSREETDEKNLTEYFGEITVLKIKASSIFGRVKKAWLFSGELGAGNSRDLYLLAEDNDPNNGFTFVIDANKFFGNIRRFVVVVEDERGNLGATTFSVKFLRPHFVIKSYEWGLPDQVFATAIVQKNVSRRLGTGYLALNISNLGGASGWVHLKITGLRTTEGWAVEKTFFVNGSGGEYVIPLDFVDFNNIYGYSPGWYFSDGERNKGDHLMHYTLWLTTLYGENITEVASGDINLSKGPKFLINDFALGSWPEDGDGDGKIEACEAYHYSFDVVNVGDPVEIVGFKVLEYATPDNANWIVQKVTEGNWYGAGELDETDFNNLQEVAQNPGTVRHIAGRMPTWESGCDPMYSGQYHVVLRIWYKVPGEGNITYVIQTQPKEVPVSYLEKNLDNIHGSKKAIDVSLDYIGFIGNESGMGLWIKNVGHIYYVYSILDAYGNEVIGGHWYNVIPRNSEFYFNVPNTGICPLTSFNCTPHYRTTIIFTRDNICNSLEMAAIATDGIVSIWLEKGVSNKFLKRIGGSISVRNIVMAILKATFEKYGGVTTKEEPSAKKILSDMFSSTEFLKAVAKWTFLDMIGVSPWLKSKSSKSNNKVFSAAAALADNPDFAEFVVTKGWVDVKDFLESASWSEKSVVMAEFFLEGSQAVSGFVPGVKDLPFFGTLYDMGEWIAYNIFDDSRISLVVDIIDPPNNFTVRYIPQKGELGNNASGASGYGNLTLILKGNGEDILCGKVITNRSAINEVENLSQTIETMNVSLNGSRESDLFAFNGTLNMAMTIGDNPDTIILKTFKDPAEAKGFLKITYMSDVFSLDINNTNKTIHYDASGLISPFMGETGTKKLNENITMDENGSIIEFCFIGNFSEIINGTLVFSAKFTSLFGVDRSNLTLNISIPGSANLHGNITNNSSIFLNGIPEHIEISNGTDNQSFVPDITFVNPAFDNDSIPSGSPIIVETTDINVENITYTIDNSFSGKTSNGYISTSSLSNGHHSIKVEVTDAFGFKNSAEREFNIFGFSPPKSDSDSHHSSSYEYYNYENNSGNETENLSTSENLTGNLAEILTNESQRESDKDFLEKEKETKENQGKDSSISNAVIENKGEEPIISYESKKKSEEEKETETAKYSEGRSLKSISPLEFLSLIAKTIQRKPLESLLFIFGFSVLVFVLYLIFRKES